MFIFSYVCVKTYHSGKQQLKAVQRPGNEASKSGLAMIKRLHWGSFLKCGKLQDLVYNAKLKRRLWVWLAKLKF